MTADEIRDETNRAISLIGKTTDAYAGVVALEYAVKFLGEIAAQLAEIKADMPTRSSYGGPR